MDIDSFVVSAVQKAYDYNADLFTDAWEKDNSIIRAMANEMPFAPDDSILQAVIDKLNKSNLYPEDPNSAKVLREKIAQYSGVEEDNITAGNGSLDILDIVFRLFLEPGRNLLTSKPDYSAYFGRPVLFGGGVTTATSADNLSIQVDSLLEKINPTIKLIILSRPHNPSGTMLSETDIIRLLETDLPVLVDEAYIEFSNINSSVVGLLSKYNNLLISRTFSKAFGLAGFRMGYLISNPKIIEYAKRAKPVMNVNLLAQTAVIAALDNIGSIQANIEKIKLIRHWLFDELCKIPGLKPIPSETNFIMINCSNSGLTSKFIVDALYKKNIFIRDFSNKPGIPLNSYFRITVGKKEQMQQILQALKDIIGN
ncbi:MAG: histidinol-phosphate transaminase [Pelolinea sp.]|nr:histidinol-phosphate transaminase [Pelolinea sp.]